MEAATRKFETEGGIRGVNKQAKRGDSLYSYPLSNVSDRVEDDGYFSFCKIKFEVKPELSGTTQEQSLVLESVSHSMLMLSGSGGISLGSEVLETLILSPNEHLESSTAPSNVHCKSNFIGQNLD